MTPKEAISHLEIKDREVTAQHVKSAYRQLMLKWHPDKFTEKSQIEQATRKAQDLNHAYEVLSIYFDSHDTLVWGARTSIPNYTQRTQPTSNHSSRGTASGRGQRFWHEIVEHGFPDERVFEVFFFSSHLVSGGYNAVERILYQKFHKHGSHAVVYRYYDVPQTIWDGLLTAPSHGRYAIRYINYSFRYELCRGPNRPYNPTWRLHEQT